MSYKGVGYKWNFYEKEKGFYYIKQISWGHLKYRESRLQEIGSEKKQFMYYVIHSIEFNEHIGKYLSHFKIYIKNKDQWKINT